MPAPSACSTAAARPTPGCCRTSRSLETTLLPTPDRITINRTTGALPSRAAANLFWVGRYVERTEATLRLVRALVNRLSESDEGAIEAVEADIVALLERLGRGAATTC